MRNEKRSVIYLIGLVMIVIPLFSSGVYRVENQAVGGKPFGEIATPVDGSVNLNGAIAVTGWALDDGEVVDLLLYRSPLAGEGQDVILVGHGVFVEGARPDVAAAFPGYPGNTRAGWGYMLLTQALPNNGNGTFTLYAIAVDNQGNEVTLGSKTFSCDNAHAVAPFGTIDEPVQGGVAKGSNYRVVGWVLTPLPNQIPVDGSTIRILIDNQDIGPAHYNIYRADIAGFFPSYANSNGALAYQDIDTTRFANGLHTISWNVTDNAGNTQGIGSRFFTIQNEGTPLQVTCSAVPEEGTPPLAVALSCTPTGGNGPGTYHFQWQLGDGSTSTLQSLEHTYTEEGSYPVTLTVNSGNQSITCTLTVTVSPQSGVPYPRLGMWWPDSWEQAVSDLARYDFIGWGGTWENETTLAQLKKQKPQQKHFTSITITETSWDDWQYYPEIMSQIPGTWFLTQVGSSLSGSINQTEVDIFVEQTRDTNGEPLFATGDLLACGFETMKLLSVDHNEKKLTVKRGVIRSATSHGTGSRIAAHITFWPRSWVMNLSTLCPLHDAGHGPESWADWAIREYLGINFPDPRDGYLIDRIEAGESWLVSDQEYGRNIDADCSNRLVKDNYAAFDSAWNQGIRNALKQIRLQLGGKILFGNSFGAYYDLLNGAIWESCPGNWSDSTPEVYNDWVERVLGKNGYIEVSHKGFSPNFSLVETYELEEMLENPETNNPLLDPGFKPNYQRMRFGLTTALLGNGYFSYEINTNGHGSLGLMWFDEYDNAGQRQGYLGFPEGEPFVLFDFEEEGKVFRRNFTHGIVICNPSGRKVTVNLENSFQLIKGKQVPAINTGKTVTSVTIAPHDGRILLK